MLLPIVEDILNNAIFPEEELQIHKQNAIQRLMVNLRQCEYVADQKIDALLFGENHPYGRYSKVEDISALVRDNIVEFYRKAYNLNNVKIFAAGKVDESTITLLNDHFGKTTIIKEEPPEPENSSITASLPKTLHETIDENGVQGAIRLGRQFPKRDHVDYAPMVVLNTLFGGYFGSRLMSNIREEKGYTYGIYSSLSPYLHGSSLSIHTEAGRDVLEACITEVHKEMKLLREEAIEEEELNLVKNYLLGNILGDLDGPFEIMKRWRNLIQFGFDEQYFYNNINTYKTIQPQKLQQLANEYLNEKDYHEVVII